MNTIVLDGNLTLDEALKALRKAAQVATEKLPTALRISDSEEYKQKIIKDRDIILLAYLTCLNKTLMHTGALFEKMASDLENEADNVRKKVESLKSTTEVINLFAELVQLAASLSLAFA